MSASIASGEAKEKAGHRTRSASRLSLVERERGIEPPYSAWEADVLPLNYSRTDSVFECFAILSHFHVECKRKMTETENFFFDAVLQKSSIYFT